MAKAMVADNGDAGNTYDVAPGKGPFFARVPRDIHAAFPVRDKRGQIVTDDKGHPRVRRLKSQTIHLYTVLGSHVILPESNQPRERWGQVWWKLGRSGVARLMDCTVDTVDTHAKILKHAGFLAIRRQHRKPTVYVVLDYLEADQIEQLIRDDPDSVDLEAVRRRFPSVAIPSDHDEPVETHVSDDVSRPFHTPVTPLSRPCHAPVTPQNLEPTDIGSKQGLGRSPSAQKGSLSRSPSAPIVDKTLGEEYPDRRPRRGGAVARLSGDSDMTSDVLERDLPPAKRAILLERRAERERRQYTPQPLPRAGVHFTRFQASRSAARDRAR